MIPRFRRTSRFLLAALTSGLLLLTSVPIASAQAPSFRAASTLNGGGTLAVPAGSTASDWLVLYVISTSPLATPSGWTLTASRTTWTAYAYYSYVFTRQKGSATDVTLAPTLGGLMMLAYQNVSGIGTVGAFSEAGGSTLPLNAITPQHPQSQVLALTSDRDPAAPTPPAGFTTRLSFATSYFGQNFADKAYGSTASTGSPTWAQSSTYPAVGVLIELLPPPASPPSLSQAFSPASINQGGSSTLTFTLGNPNGIGLTNASFSATLSGMTLANTTIGGTCVGVTASPALTTGASSFTLSVPSLPTTGCTVSVAVTSTSVGNQTATTSGATAAEAPTTGAPAAPATLTVTGTPAAPTLQAAFAPAWIAVGGTSTLTVQVGNPSNIPLTQAHFSLSLSGMTLAEATLGGTCSGVTANPALAVGASSVDLTIASLPAAGCTLTLKVTSGTLGSNGISTSGVTTTENPTAGAGANPAYLTVNPAEVGFRYVHPDHLGTPRVITHPATNDVLWRWDNVEPFGNNAPNGDPTSSGATTIYNLRFPGQYYDVETGTYYNYFRDYDPAIGRYIESDPIGLRGGVNTYLYAEGQPNVFSDRFGLEAESTCCAKSKKGDALGWITCCNGRKTICTDTSSIKNKKAAEIMQRCITRHEEQHLPQCPSCDNVTTFEKLRFKDTVNDYGGECVAYLAGSKCLKTMMLERACGNDNACRDEIKQQLKFSDSEAQSRCRAWAVSSMGR